MPKQTLDSLHIPITDQLHEPNLQLGNMCEDIRRKFYAKQIPQPRAVSVYLKELIPSQDTIFDTNLVKVADYTDIHPILVVDYLQRLYIADGHHRAFIEASRGRETIQAYVVKVDIKVAPIAV